MDYSSIFLFSSVYGSLITLLECFFYTCQIQLPGTAGVIYARTLCSTPYLAYLGNSVSGQNASPNLGCGV